MPDIRLQRRDLLVAPLLAAMIPVTTRASILDPAETILTLPPDMPQMAMTAGSRPFATTPS
jgi:hypothetical protein